MLGQVAVIDTSVLIALDHVELLEHLGTHYERVLVPSRVRGEFLSETPDPLRAVSTLLDASPFEPCDDFDLPSLEILKERLDPGEAEAIAQMQPQAADCLLIDESDGRRVALEARHRVVGTARILAELHLDGRADLWACVEQLRTGIDFRVTDEIVARALAEAMLERGA